MMSEYNFNGTLSPSVGDFYLSNKVVLPMPAFIILCEKLGLDYRAANVEIGGVKIIGSSLMEDGKAIAVGTMAKKMKEDARNAK